eukprot:2476941-Alexandrium_andersonii.AAC.1
MQGQRMPTSGSTLSKKQKRAQSGKDCDPLGKAFRVQPDPGADCQGASHPGHRTPSVQPRQPSWGST